MNKQTKNYSQADAADYLRSQHGVKITAAELSVITKFHLGPECSRYGYTKVFTEEELDEFAREILSHKDAAILMAAA